MTKVKGFVIYGIFLWFPPTETDTQNNNYCTQKFTLEGSTHKLTNTEWVVYKCKLTSEGNSV